MIFSARRLLLTLAIVMTAIGVVIWLDPESLYLSWIIVACGLITIIVLNIFRPPGRVMQVKPETSDIRQLSEARRRELLRGTSLFLRESRYRYAIRYENTDREPFSAVINTVQLGFLPVVISDNESEKEGVGYVAFVHDGKRWLGPGLPCPGSPQRAAEHAARCVAPLDDDEITRY